MEASRAAGACPVQSCNAARLSEMSYLLDTSKARTNTVGSAADHVPVTLIFTVNAQLSGLLLAQLTVALQFCRDVLLRRRGGDGVHQLHGEALAFLVFNLRAYKIFHEVNFSVLAQQLLKSIESILKKMQLLKDVFNL